jgi:hypothetical protein
MEIRPCLLYYFIQDLVHFDSSPAQEFSFATGRFCSEKRKKKAPQDCGASDVEDLDGISCN